MPQELANPLVPASQVFVVGIDIPNYDSTGTYRLEILFNSLPDFNRVMEVLQQKHLFNSSFDLYLGDFDQASQVLEAHNCLPHMDAHTVQSSNVVKNPPAFMKDFVCSISICKKDVYDV